jgi:hypothetical protein
MVVMDDANREAALVRYVQHRFKQAHGVGPAGDAGYHSPRVRQHIKFVGKIQDFIYQI